MVATLVGNRQQEMARRRQRLEARDTLVRRLATGAEWLRVAYEAAEPTPVWEDAQRWGQWTEALRAWEAMERLVRELFGWTAHVGEGDRCGPDAVIACDACLVRDGPLLPADGGRPTGATAGETAPDATQATLFGLEAA